MDQHECSFSSGALIPSWFAAGDERPTFSALTGDLDVTAANGVIIVGGGIAGLTTAYLLARAGKHVVLLEDGKIASGETSRTTAHLMGWYDDYYHKVEKIFGVDGAKKVAKSQYAAINLIESIVSSEGIDCDFERLDGYLMLADGDTPATLEKELAAAHRANLSDVSLLQRVPLPAANAVPCLQFPANGQFHPLKYIIGLARAVQNLGGVIYTHTHVKEILDDVTTASVRTSSGFTVKASAVVVATNSPVNDTAIMHTKQAPYRTYVIAARIERDAIPRAIYWDTAAPYHYVRFQRNLVHAHQQQPFDYLIVGGEDHKTGQHDANPAHRFDKLEQWARSRFPIGAVDYRWSGQVLEPNDMLPYAGRNPTNKNVFIITGDSGTGMTNCTLGASVVCDLILGHDNEYASLLDPARKASLLHPSAAVDYLAENLNVGWRYARDYLKLERTRVADIPAGEGALVQSGLKKLACYRDANGKLHACSAVCTHLSGIVHWNSAEKSWDCCLHGSRFDPYGKVINGPAITDLEELVPPGDVAAGHPTTAAAAAAAAPIDEAEVVLQKNAATFRTGATTTTTATTTASSFTSSPAAAAAFAQTPTTAGTMQA